MPDDAGESNFARGPELQRDGRFAEAAEAYLEAAKTGLTSNLTYNLGVCGRTDAPWYPSLKLYRQTQLRDWSEIVDQVLRDL